MSHEFNQWLAGLVTALESGCCIERKEISMRRPINHQEIGLEVADKMRYRVAGHERFNDRCIPLEPR